MIRTITLHPSRIGCPSLPGTMKGIVASLEGVSDVKVRYEERSLDVTFDDAQITPEAIITTIGRELGLMMEAADHGATKNGNVAETCPM